jgi:uncharacterized damage-inducible protein DinB
MAMSTTTTRAEEYAARFAAANDEVIALVVDCTEEQWRLRCVDEERSVAVVAHHIAEVNAAFTRMVARLARGQTYSPQTSMAEIDRQNAQHARDHAGVGKPEVLDGLRSSGEAIARQLAVLSDAQLDRVAGVFGGREMSVAQVVEYVVIGHTAAHLDSIRATVAG